MTIETEMNAPSGVSSDGRAIAAEMKSAIDARIEEIEKRGAADPLLDVKLKKIETSLERQQSAQERLAMAQARPAMGDDTRRGDPEHKSTWSAYMRRGDDSGIARLDLKSVNIGTEAQGGYSPKTYVLFYTTKRVVRGVRRTSTPSRSRSSPCRKLAGT